MHQELERITYVEDEPDIRAVAELALTALGGFTIDVCTSGLEALDKAPTFKPDLILLDVMMPGIDGMETFRRLRTMSELAETPVIFMTAKAQRHEVESYKQIGALDVIPKPFDPMTLADEVKAIWENARILEAA